MSGERCSALWGKKGGGESRSSALWGKGGRGGIVALAATLALAIPAAAISGPGRSGGKDLKAAVPQTLLDAAQADPNGKFAVIILGDGGEKSDKLAEKVAKKLASGEGATGDEKQILKEQLTTRFSTISAVLGKLAGKDVLKLAKESGILSITPDAAVSLNWDNPQKWDNATGVNWFWTSPNSGTQAATIAIVDSGIDASAGAFGSRLLTQVDLGGGNASSDDRGHGTFVATMAAGSGTYSGAAPTAKLVSLDVVDGQGRANTSDVIRAADWIYEHKGEYSIRVANFSLGTSQPTSLIYDPLDKAVERLWLSGVVVVASAGNYAVSGQASGVLFAPANDPFVITVGAADLRGTTDQSDDKNAPWSAYGYTSDGFAKPELGAPGRYLIGAVPENATLKNDFPTKVKSPTAIKLSGTSFAAPIVSGMAADLLGAHPDWTPDQVKGALMVSAVPLPSAASNSLGVGEANLQRAFGVGNPPNPNLALNQFLVSDPAGGSVPVFSTASWTSAALANASWSSASWSSASWSSASWSSASWSSASWSSASWSSASWSSASWSSASWSSASWTNNSTEDGDVED